MIQGISEREERAQLADVITMIKSRVAARISLSSQFDLFGMHMGIIIVRLSNSMSMCLGVSRSVNIHSCIAKLKTW